MNFLPSFILRLNNSVLIYHNLILFYLSPWSVCVHFFASYSAHNGHFTW
jgi:hypothetical protein